MSMLNRLSGNRCLMYYIYECVESNSNFDFLIALETVNKYKDFVKSMLQPGVSDTPFGHLVFKGL